MKKLKKESQNISEKVPIRTSWSHSTTTTPILHFFLTVHFSESQASEVITHYPAGQMFMFLQRAAFSPFCCPPKMCCAIKDTVTGKHLSGDTFPEIRFASDISSQYPTRHLSRNHTICSVLKYKYTNIQIHKYRNAQIHKDSNT